MCAHQATLPPMSKMAYASTLAAGMMYLMVQQGDTVSLITFDDQVRKFYEPTGTLPGLKPMLLGLEEIEAKRKGEIEAALHDPNRLGLCQALDGNAAKPNPGYAQFGLAQSHCIHPYLLVIKTCP